MAIATSCHTYPCLLPYLLQGLKDVFEGSWRRLIYTTWEVKRDLSHVLLLYETLLTMKLQLYYEANFKALVSCPPHAPYITIILAC